MGNKERFLEALTEVIKKYGKGDNKFVIELDGDHYQWIDNEFVLIKRDVKGEVLWVSLVILWKK